MAGAGRNFLLALPAAKNLKSLAPGGPSMSNFPVNAPGVMGQDLNQSPPDPQGGPNDDQDCTAQFGHLAARL